MKITEAIAAVTEQAGLNEDDAFMVMEEIMSGQASDAQIGALIASLRVKGETESEIAGFARAIRAGATKVMANCDQLIDTCGTGGDMANTFNISTATAFVVAACGVKVAKHGNRSISSKCGSADVLEALGVELNLSPAEALGALEKTGITFMFAPLFHAAMKHAVKARREIGIRTIFNLVGPLSNPAGADCQLLGVYKPEYTETLGKVLLRLGVKRALVVHGAGGLDEISTLGPTRVTEVGEKGIVNYHIDPAMFGLPLASAEDLEGGNPSENSALLLRIFGGEPGPARDIVILNAAAALYAAGMVSNIAAGLKPACRAIDSGEAGFKLEQLKRYTKSLPEKEAGAGKLCSTA
ncbi:MAG: anthranilate phosphoribosyltransferase [Bacillota bacterium]|nr:anthranilate phosphoribosyltransferase [Bacillota bacterium]